MGRTQILRKRTGFRGPEGGSDLWVRARSTLLGRESSSDQECLVVMDQDTIVKHGDIGGRPY